MRKTDMLWITALLSLIGLSLYMSHKIKTVVEGYGGGGGHGGGGRGGHGGGRSKGNFGRTGYYGASRGFNYGGYGGASSYNVSPLYLDSPYEDVYYGNPYNNGGYIIPRHIYSGERDINELNETIYDSDTNEVIQSEVIPASSLELLENM